MVFSSISECAVVLVGPVRVGNLWEQGVPATGPNSATGCELSLDLHSPIRDMGQ